MVRKIVLALIAVAVLVVGVSAVDKNTDAWVSEHVIYVGNHPKVKPYVSPRTSLDDVARCFGDPNLPSC
jgi:hypothetical protein